MNLVFPQLLQFSDVALLCLRLMVAAVFFWSGLQHARDPIGRAASIGLSPRVVSDGHEVVATTRTPEIVSGPEPQTEGD